jgi:hypothetical protein
MSDSTFLTRRRAMQLIAALGTMGGRSSYLGSAAETRAFFDKGSFNGLQVDFRALERFVMLFRESGDVSTSQSVLEAEVFGPNLDRSTREMSGEELKTFLQNKIAADFLQKRTIKLDGWILSQTEVRIWLIYFLLHSSEAE